MAIILQFIIVGKEAGKREEFETLVDKTYRWQGRQIHIITVQNQTYVDYRMVLRNMLSESIGYHRQWKQKRIAHERAGDLAENTDEFLSGIVKDDKFTPIITLVVYCGKEHEWNGARCLHELLDIDEELKEYVTNYKLNLYDCHEHDTFDEYHTGLRQLFEVIRYGRDKEYLQRIMEKSREAYNNLDGDTREMIEVMANVKIPEEHESTERKEKRYSMLKAFEDMRLEGKTEGKTEYLTLAVCKKLQKNKTAEVIAAELEEELSEVERVIEAQKKVGSYDTEKICRILLK